jgi:hypothetical protein
MLRIFIPYVTMDPSVVFFFYIIDHINNNLCLFGDNWLNVRMILLTYSCDHGDGIEESSSKAPSYLKRMD